MITYLIGSGLSFLIWLAFIKYNLKKGWIDWSTPTTVKSLVLVSVLSWISVIFVLGAALYIWIFPEKVKLPNENIKG